MLRVLSIRGLSHKIKKKIRQRVSDLGYVKVEIQRFPRQGLRGAVPDTADVLIGEDTLRGWRLHQTGWSRNHQLQDVQRFPPMDSLQTFTHKQHNHMFRNKQPQMSFCVVQCSSIFGHNRQSAHSRKLKGKWIQHENKQRPGLQQKGRLFIVWVCLQIYCADTRQLFFLLFLSLAHEHSQKQQGTKESYSEHDAWRFPTIPSDVRDLNDFAGVSIKVTTEIS